MVDLPVPLASANRKRSFAHISGTSCPKSRLRALSAAARENAPDPHYLDRTCSRDAPLITERQREKVVKYINEVRKQPRDCAQFASPKSQAL